jgi:hypothetical protein
MTPIRLHIGDPEGIIVGGGPQLHAIA